MNIVVNINILVEPKLKTPITSDMADIVDAFRRNGLIKKIPGAFHMGDTLVVHPVIYAEMKRIANKQHQLAERMLYGRSIY